MDQFLALRASTSSGSAEQLGFHISDQHGEGGSAVQPALQLRSIADVRRCLIHSADLHIAPICSACEKQ